MLQRSRNSRTSSQQPGRVYPLVGIGVPSFELLDLWRRVRSISEQLMTHRFFRRKSQLTKVYQPSPDFGREVLSVASGTGEVAFPAPRVHSDPRTLHRGDACLAVVLLLRAALLVNRRPGGMFLYRLGGVGCHSTAAGPTFVGERTYDSRRGRLVRVRTFPSRLLPEPCGLIGTLGT